MYVSTHMKTMRALVRADGARLRARPGMGRSGKHKPGKRNTPSGRRKGKKEIQDSRGRICKAAAMVVVSLVALSFG